MAHVQKRTKSSGSFVYVVKWRTPDGRGRSKSGFRTKKQAEAYATTVDFNQNRGSTYDPASGNVHFRDAARVWLDSRVDLKPRTRQSYEYILNKGANLDATFGGYPLNKITREDIAVWVDQRVQAGKRPSTIRHAYFVLKLVLDQAAADGRIPANPCDHVKLPTDRTATTTVIGAGESALAKAARRTPDGVVDPAQFLTAEQVSVLVQATPWPYSVLVDLAAWSGLRAAELAGLQIGDVTLPPTVPYNRPGAVDVQRTVLVKYGPIANPGSGATAGAPEIVYDTPKTKGSRRRVPIPPSAVSVLRDYLAVHPRRNEPSAPLFPASTLRKVKPTGVAAPRHANGPRTGERMTPAEQAARKTVEAAQARLILDWHVPVVHRNFYGAVYLPAMLRANLAGAGIDDVCTFHSLRHTYASLCIAAGIQPFMLSKFMGHANTNVTLGVYAHLFHDDHSDAMAALGAMSTQTADNVVRLRG
jgi:integrase